MASKTETRRTELRNKLIDIAEKTIATEGLSALRARDLAAQAGCAVGAIYNVFGDLAELALAANARTFHRLGEAVIADLKDAPDDNLERLVIMGLAYHRFAANNYLSWSAVFDVERPSGQAAPDWYIAEMEKLFGHIIGPLTQMFPEESLENRIFLTRALFSSVHGIVVLGLDEARISIPAADIDRMINLVLRQLTAHA
jgi:AcrR family transcriptional regulator